ncbi:hypothetical protein WOLCODRAFT_70247 [Wolfiporia cocos MD-104 SS10]|uniref:DUF1793-domain-containing protein n=1 Tax=Wolfiporia cocos (strain MD-104) TaxID=742152 RepID=A0A2H3JPE8_WOLCO|nr:hypothetical protein WOLCODRAFT_70247 [Wolfiporia cocos MD-104 SS10]
MRTGYSLLPSACLLLTLAHIPLSYAQQTFWPAAVPLTVRSPFFNTWSETVISANNTASGWPIFWTQTSNAVLEWTGHVRVDNFTYKWMGTYGGSAVATATLLETTITPTRTIMAFQAGAMNLTVTYFTPIEACLPSRSPIPVDWVKQSMPFSYVSVSAQSNDGKPHSFQVFSHLSLEWVSGNYSATATWSTNVTESGTIIHQAHQVDAQPFTDVNQQATDGTLYFAIPNVRIVSYTVGGYVAVDSYFIGNGNLSDTDAIANASSGPNVNVLALAADLKTISSTQDPVVFTVGYVRDPSINYTSASGESRMYSPYFVTQSSDMLGIVESFVTDYTDALARAEVFDDGLMSNASSISAQYANIVALAARQIFGTLDIAVPSDPSNGWNTDDVRIFMKDMGNSRRVNPVEQLYAAFPAFLYVNASLGRPLLAALLESQDVASNTLPYAAQDIGAAYPNATSDLVTHDRGVEQSGNMLIMILAHARYSGDGSLISTYYNRLRAWADYLTQNTLTPTGQADADEQNAANMTNLAVKGIIAIYAMSEMSHIMGNTTDATRYASTATSFMHSWQSLVLAGSASHLPFTYGSSASSWVLAYNLYADMLLGTGLVSQEIYQMQTEFYQSLIGSVSGVQSNQPFLIYSQLAWLAFVAASAQNPTVRQDLLMLLWEHASYNGSAGVFPAQYDVVTGVATGGMASPALGAVFAPLALDLTNKSIAINGSTGIPSPQHPGNGGHGYTDTSSHSNIGAIVGGVVGGVGSVLLFALVAFLLCRCRVRRRRAANETGPYAYTPFGMREMVASSSTHAEPVSLAATPDVAYEGAQNLAPWKGYRREHVWGTSALSTTNASSLPTELASVTLEEAEGTGLRNLQALRMEVDRLLRVVQGIEGGSSGSELDAPPSYTPAASGQADV